MARMKLTKREQKMQPIIEGCLKTFMDRVGELLKECNINSNYINISGRKPLTGIDFPIELSIYYLEYKDSAIYIDIDIDWVDSKNKDKFIDKINRKIHMLAGNIHKFRLVQKYCGIPTTEELEVNLPEVNTIGLLSTPVVSEVI